MVMQDYKPSSKDEMLLLQKKGLLWTVNHVYSNSPFYRRKFDEIGLQPGDICELDDIVKLPMTTKEELRDNYPFGLMSVPERDVVRIHASSGTTGKKTVAYYTQKDIDVWANMMARCFSFAGCTPDDRIQATSGYGLWTAGAGFQAGIERLGAMAVPVGPAGNDLQIELLIDMQSTVFVATSSYALLLAEEVKRRGLRDKINLRVGVIGSERWSDKMRSRVEEMLGIETFDIIGMTETYGPGTGIDCQQHSGIHYWSDHLIFEILDPDGKPCSPGEHGEIVVTSLSKEAMPLIRYKTRDITREIPGDCACGSPFFRIDRILGRTDDMFKFRGVIIFPSQIDHLITQTEELGSEYQVILRRQGGRDDMNLRIEAKEGFQGNKKDVEKKFLQTFKSIVGVSPKIEVLDYKGLPRSEKKTKRVFDEREL